MTVRTVSPARCAATPDAAYAGTITSPAAATRRIPVVETPMEYRKHKPGPMKNCDPLLCLENAAIRTGSETVFENTCWTIYSGQHWAVAGPTGAGKSLLIDAVVRKRSLASGRIRYFFDPTASSSPQGRGYCYPGEIIRICPADSGLSNSMNALYYQARWHSMETEQWPEVRSYLAPENLMKQNPYEVLAPTNHFSERLSLRDELLSRLGARHLLARRLHQLSNGELRKIEMIRALMQNPKILVIETPLAGLDEASRSIMQEILKTLMQRRDVSILLVDAALESLPEGLTHMLCVSGRRVLKQGPYSEVVNDPAVTSLFAPTAEPDPGPALSLLPEAPFLSGSQRINESSLIAMHRVSLCYGGVDVLKDISWRMQPGEHWAIQGPNGAGKSSLMSLILADNPQAYANEIWLFGKKRGSGESIWEIKQHIGFVAPELQLAYSGGFTCRQVVCSGFFDSIGLYRDPGKERKARAEQWIRALHLENLADRFFRDVSEGEKRLALIARALVKSPRLLVLDEPCSALDKSRCSRIIRVLDLLVNHRSNPGAPHLLYITHQQAEIPAAVTHVMRLENGRVVFAGHREEDPKGG